MVSRLGSFACLDLVLSLTPEMDEDGVEETEAVADDNGDFRGDVSWGVFWTEGLWADDVTGAYVSSQ